MFFGGFLVDLNTAYVGFIDSDGHHWKAGLLWQPHCKSEAAAGHDHMESWRRRSWRRQQDVATWRHMWWHGSRAKLGASTGLNSACENA